MIKVVYTGSREPPSVPGVEVVHIPMLENVPIRLPDGLAEEVALSRGAGIAVFFSQNSAEHVLDELGAQTFDGIEVWAVGDKTAGLLSTRLGRSVHRPSDASFEGVVAELREVSADVAAVFSFELADGPHRLDEVGLSCGVRRVAVYETMPCAYDNLDALLRDIAPRWVVFASPRAFRAFKASLHTRTVGDSYRVAVIGPRTRDAVEAEGERVDYVPDAPDLEALLAGLQGR